MTETDQSSVTTDTPVSDDGKQPEQSEERSVTQQALHTIERLFAFLLTMVFIYFASKLMGGSDIAFVVFWVVAWFFVAYRLIDIRSKIRKLSQVYFTRNTMVHRFLGKKSILIWSVSVMLAGFVSMSFLVTTKVLFLENGTLVSMIALAMPLLLFQFSGDHTFSVDQQVSTADNQETVAELVDLGVKAVVMTLILALIFSTLDTVNFYINTANFTNFSDLALDRSIAWSSSGQFSRIPVNFMAIQSAFGSASINELITSLGASKDTFSPFWFWSLSIFFNILKLLPFCITLLFIFTALKNTQQKSFAYTNRAITILLCPIGALISRAKPNKEKG